MRRAGRGDPEAKARGKQGPEELRKCCQQKRASTYGVNVEQGHPRECEGDEAKSTRGCEGDVDGRAGLHENGSAVKGDNVDTAELLGKLYMKGQRVPRRGRSRASLPSR